jgi:chemotaxis family two-component system response regulator Rcp1
VKRMPITELEDGAGQPVRIFLVEDNEGDVFLLSMALDQARFSHSLTVFRDGADAMTFLRKSSAGTEVLPDLVLLDLNLPRVDGTTLIEMFRAEPALCNIPVILLSSSRSPDDSARARQFSKCIFVVKPSDLSSYMGIGHLARDFWIQSREPPSGNALDAAGAT